MSEYIKREDALNKFKRMPPSPTKEFIIETLNAIPAADVEPVVRGEWVQNTDGKWTCSVCDCLAIGGSYDGENWQYNTIRCPNCGAHMERSGSGE